MHKRINVVVAVSGGGRSLLNLIEHEKKSDTLWHVCAVISSSPDCKANQVAVDHGKPLFVGDFSRSGLAQTSQSLHKFLQVQEAQWIVLAGFLKLFPTFPEFQNHVINIHPALLPKFGGKGMHGHHVHEAVLKAQEATSGASVHFVNERYDEGAVISQIVVPVLSTDTPDTLAARVFQGECRLLPETLTQLIQKKLPLPDGRIWEIRI